MGPIKVREPTKNTQINLNGDFNANFLDSEINYKLLGKCMKS